MTTGLVFNIQHFSVHDGPGIRTVVFLKGCPLRCAWCCNPESQAPYPELAYNSSRCIGTAECFLCGAVCPRGAITAGAGGHVVIDRDLCERSFKCADVCPSKALHRFGTEMSAKHIIDAVESEAIFHTRSGGGLTLSGGEPLMQPEFALEILRLARERYIDAAIETCGFAEWEAFEAAARLLKTVLFDLKHMDSAKHRQFTGVPNETILENLTKLRKSFPDLLIVVRTPVVPGFNDSEDELGAIKKFVSSLPGFGSQTRHELLPYHRMGEQKYAFLDCGNETRAALHMTTHGMLKGSR